MGVYRETNRALRVRIEHVLSRIEARGHALPSELRDLLQELELRQVELEIRNDALREAQADLACSREKYRDLFERGPCAYLNLDRRSCIADANQAALALFGATRQQLIGRPFAEFVHPAHAATFARHRLQVTGPTGRGSCELELCGPTGRRREVHVESVRTTARSTDVRLVLIDVTETREREREREQAHRLEALATLASGVAHDFNNLLMAVLGSADLALDRVAAGRDPSGPLDDLREAVLGGRSIAQQLLSFGRADPREEARVDLNALVTSAAPLLRRLLGDRIALHLDLQAADPRVCAEAGRLRHILLDLASNARHAMPDGGAVIVETLDAAAPENAGRPDATSYATLRVTDTGSGMAGGVRARALDPFFTTRAIGSGRGLGLSRVYGAVREAGGRIDIVSRPGHGTSVTLDWPRGAGHERSRAAAPAPARARESSGTSVLIVDDERLVRLAMRHYLEKAGYRVHEAGSGEEAAELLAERRLAPRVVVSDVVLPGIKGPEVSAIARAHHPGVGVVLVSAHAPELLVERGYIAHGTPVLRKPFTPEELCAAIRAHFVELQHGAARGSVERRA